MKTIKMKILALILLLSMLATPILASCKPAGGVQSESTTDAVTEAPKVNIVLFENGETSYTVIRPDGADKATVNASTSVWNGLSTYTEDSDKSFDIKNDLLKRDETIPENETAILVGFTNRPFTEVAFNGLSYSDYRVQPIGTRIYIAAYTAEAFEKAIKQFLSYVKEHTVDGKCVIESSFLIEGSVGGVIAELPAVVGKTPLTIHDMNDSCQLVVHEECEKSDYEEYLTVISEKYSLYTSNVIGENIFNTFKNDKYLVHTYFMGKTGYIRTTIEPLSSTSVIPLESENKYTTVTTPLVTQIGCERVGITDSFQNGMCYIFRLSDGRFIIYDGGFATNNYDATKIANTLKEQAVDKNNIVIAAWIMTHAHADHNGAFRSFIKTFTPNNNSSVFTIQNVIRNTPTIPDATGANHDNPQYIEDYEQQERYLKQNGCNLIKTHPGQEFFFADAKITFLYNLEMFIPKKFDYFNTSTSVSIFEIAGQKFAMLGDCSEDASAIIVKNYTGVDLVCDFLQVAHHGYQGGTTPLYKLFDPTYVLWPAAEYDFYEKLQNNSRSEYLVTLSTKVKGIYTAGASKYVFTLPFDGTNYTKTTN